MDQGVIPVTANESTAVKRRVNFFLRSSADGVSAASKSGGQPQISTDGGAWTNTGIATLTDLGNGEHYADLTQAAVATAGQRIRTRFKDDDTIEERGTTVLVVGYNPASSTDLGLSNLTNLRPKKNTALSAFEFAMLSSADHVTGATGKTITATRSIDGSVFAACTNSASEVGNGIYKIDLSAADLNGNVITFRFTATAADDTFLTVMTQT